MLVEAVTHIATFIAYRCSNVEMNTRQFLDNVFSKYDIIPLSDRRCNVLR